MRTPAPPVDPAAQERVRTREEGKDEARAFLRRMVAGKMPRGKHVRERMLAAKALLYEKADLSHADNSGQALVEQQNRFDELLAAMKCG